MSAEIVHTPGQCVVYSRALATPVIGWVPEIGPVKIVAEREIFGRVFQKEIIQLNTGIRGVVDAKAVFEGENILAMPVRERGPNQPHLFPPSDTEPAA